MPRIERGDRRNDELAEAAQIHSSDLHEARKICIRQQLVQILLEFFVSKPQNLHVGQDHREPRLFATTRQLVVGVEVVKQRTPKLGQEPNPNELRSVFVGMPVGEVDTHRCTEVLTTVGGIVAQLSIKKNMNLVYSSSHVNYTDLEKAIVDVAVHEQDIVLWIFLVSNSPLVEDVPENLEKAFV